MNTVLKAIQPALLSLLTATVTIFVGVGIAYLQKVKTALIKKIGVQQYNDDMSIAHAVFLQVEQQFKGLLGVATEKANLFDTTIAKLIPGLTIDQIEHYRESIVGQINQYIVKSEILEPCPFVEPDTPEEPAEKKLEDYTREELIAMLEIKK